MKTTIQYPNETYQIRLDQAIDISIPLQEGLQTVNAFYAPPLQIEPVRAGDFCGRYERRRAIELQECEVESTWKTVRIPNVLGIFHPMVKPSIKP